jgi:hypothetical protein
MARAGRDVRLCQGPGNRRRIVQGSPAGSRFLFICPVDLWSRVEVFFPPAEAAAPARLAPGAPLEAVQAVGQRYVPLSGGGAVQSNNRTKEVPQ